MEYSIQIDRIMAKFAQAKEIDKAFKVFGSSEHKYQLNKPATQSGIDSFEKKYGISLPLCYKAFLLNIGNGGTGRFGGAGPYYGIFSLDKTVDYSLCDEEYLKAPCVIYPKMRDEAWETIYPPYNADEPENEDADEDEREKAFAGILVIGSQGCTYFHGIVLNGEHKGKVVNLDMDGGKPFFTFEANFLDWYERWLDEIISGEYGPEGASWFGHRMGGSAENLLKQFLGTDDKEEKADCLDGLLQKLKLDKHILQTLEAQYLLCDDKELKIKFLYILAKFDYPRAKPHLLSALNEIPLCVFQSVFWYAKDKSKDWVAPIKAMIAAIADDETFRYCRYILEEANVDYADIIAPFAGHENPKIRSDAIYSLSLLRKRSADR